MIINFLKNLRSLAVGSKNGFSLFSLNSIDSSLEEIYTSPGEEINIVERLFSSSLVAVVSLNAPRKLKVNWNSQWAPTLELICVRSFCYPTPSAHKIGLSLQERHRNMQLLLFKYNTWREIESGPFGGVPRREFVYS